MNLLQLAWSYLRARPLGTLLNVLLLALGVGTIGFVRIVDGQVGDSLNRDARGIDLVVGAKAPIQLILAGIYHLDAPTGNIPSRLSRNGEESADPARRAVSLGDSFRGYRIVGTSPDYIGSTTAASHQGSGATRWERRWGRLSRREPGLPSAAGLSARTA
jgi:putative ABC transport system permease protein